MIYKRYILLGVVCVLSIILGILSKVSKDGVIEVKESYASVVQNIAVIQTLDNKYRSKEQNARSINNILESIRPNIKTQNATNNDIEIYVVDLEDNVLNEVITRLVNANFQIQKFEIKRANDNRAEFFVKVKF